MQENVALNYEALKAMLLIQEKRKWKSFTVFVFNTTHTFFIPAGFMKYRCYWLQMLPRSFKALAAILDDVTHLR